MVGAPSGVVITGYYRYTDMWFEWVKVLKEEDGAAVKAILAHDALISPDHPFHEEGVDGVKMYMGFFESGQARLLFSSAQMDYIRYWLHAMGYTKEIVPLPYSDCLLTESDLRNVSTVVYKDGLSLKNAVKTIEKNNKRLKGSNPVLTSRRYAFERVRTYWTAKKGVWCALDFEAWERDHKLLTEFGWSSIRWENGVEVAEQGHLMVKGHELYTNGTYVPERRYQYAFGQSESVPIKEFKARIHALLEQLATYGPVFLVFHDDKQDIKYLKLIQTPLEGLTYLLPDAAPDTGMFVIDTSDLFGALEGESAANRRGLDRVCRHLQVPTDDNFHNAGNDAHYTMLALKEMASGDPVDIQREKRWPNHTGTALKVEFKKWEEDSDYSDEEGVV